MKLVDDCPETGPGFHGHDAGIGAVDGDPQVIELAGTAHAKDESLTDIVAPAYRPAMGPSDQIQGVAHGRGQCLLVSQLGKGDGALPFDLFLALVTEVVVVIERTDAKDDKITGAKEAGVEV